MRKLAALLIAVPTISAIVLLVACGGGNNTTPSSQLATVKLSVSDPPTCGSPQGGSFAAIYVAIQDVQINASANAGDNDSNWIDLTPNLKNSAPKQVNLLGIANNQCFLAMLNDDSGTSIQPGTYQQIRIFLADNTTIIQANQDHCFGVAANCVVLNSDLTKSVPLLLSSEAKTGIKIPSGQIAGGAFVVGPGETKDLNIDFNTCASLVRQGNGGYRLKPVLHAGEVKLTSTSINGTLVDSDTNQPITGNNVVVLLEKNDGSGADSLYMETKPNNLGQFNFCPVSEGTYDLVIVAMNDTATKSYATTVVRNVQPGNAAGSVKLFPQNVDGAVSQSPATIKGLVTTFTGTAGISEDVTIRAQQLVKLSSNLKVIVPLALASSSGINFNVPDAKACTTDIKNAFCQEYTIMVPAANASVGVFATSGTAYTQDTTSPVAYSVDATATGCTPSEVPTSNLFGGGPLQVTGGGIATAATIPFVGCK